VLGITAGIFNSGLESTAIDVIHNDTYKGLSPGNYNATNNPVTFLFSSTAGAVGLLISGTAIALAIILGKYIIAAVGIFIGLIMALYVSVSSILFKLYYNEYLIGIFTLVGIAIGILVLYNVIEMFTGQGGDV
jgi:hypothetical protein